MRRASKVLSEADLEVALLRKGVGELVAGRCACPDCGRTPLVGEQTFRFGRARAVCALCRPRHRSEPDAVEFVRHSERGQTVRRIVRQAA